jgi:Protein of unknown function (DUF3905)
MSKRPKPRPPWKETPLDHWSTDIDPAIMAGDEWASEDPNSDPGAERIAEHYGLTYMGAQFMHPMHDTNYGLSDDVFVDRESE